MPAAMAGEKSMLPRRIVRGSLPNASGPCTGQSKSRASNSEFVAVQVEADKANSF